MKKSTASEPDEKGKMISLSPDEAEFVKRLANAMVESANEVLRDMAGQVFAAYRHNFTQWCEQNPSGDPTKFKHSVSLPIKLMPSEDGDVLCVASLGTAMKIKSASSINTAQMHLEFDEAERK